MPGFICKVTLGLRDEKTFQEELEEAKDGGLVKKKQKSKKKKDEDPRAEAEKAAVKAAAKMVQDAGQKVESQRTRSG